jgi:hypothetical protein
MGRNTVDKEALERWRSLRAADALPLLCEYVKRDGTFIPLKNSGSERYHVTAGGREFELVCTGEKWWDSRAERGGGGAVDLAMHLHARTFKEAVAMLRELAR